MKKILQLMAFVLFAGSAQAQTVFPAATCKEFPRSIFKPCVCYDRGPQTVKYRPSMSDLLQKMD